MLRRVIPVPLFATLLMGIAACDSNKLGPENEPQIVNSADSFEWQVTALNNVSQTFTYTWNNAGTRADVDQSAAVTGGSAILTIRDADGKQVHSGSMTTDGSFSTSEGQSGAWKIHVTLSGVTGDLNFRVQKP